MLYPSTGWDGETGLVGHSTSASFGDVGESAGVPGKTGAVKTIIWDYAARSAQMKSERVLELAGGSELRNYGSHFADSCGILLLMHVSGG